MCETRRQEIVFEEILLDGCVTAKVKCYTGRKEAVTKPTGSFPRGTIHEDIDSILPEGLPGSFEYSI
jgi:hypothetical protein